MKSLLKVMMLAVALTVLAGCAGTGTQGTQTGANKTEPEYPVGTGSY